jgi:hypothetical protein
MVVFVFSYGSSRYRRVKELGLDRGRTRVPSLAEIGTEVERSNG